MLKKEKTVQPTSESGNDAKPIVICSPVHSSTTAGGCKYGMTDCLYRGTSKCKSCIDRSEFEWDYTDRF